MSVDNKLEPDLNPCPFCGAEAFVSMPIFENGTVIITCSKNSCRFVEGISRDEAKRIWNEPKISH